MALSSSTGQFSGRNYRWILGGIAYVYQLEKHKSRLGRDCLYLPIGRTQVTIRSLSLSAYRMNRCKEVDAPEQPKINSGIVIRCHDRKMLSVKPVQIPINAPRFPYLIVSDKDSFFTSKFWCPRYHFGARLRFPPTCLLQR